MVLYKYCPKCYSLNIGLDPNTGQYICRQCSYSGPINQDSIDKINMLKKTKDAQKHAVLASNTKPLTKSSERNAELGRRKEDPYNEEIDKIGFPDSEKYPLDMEIEDTSNLMKSKTQSAEQRRGLNPKDRRSTKERLKDKGGKDWDLL